MSGFEGIFAVVGLLVVADRVLGIENIAITIQDLNKVLADCYRRRRWR